MENKRMSHFIQDDINYEIVDSQARADISTINTTLADKAGTGVATTSTNGLMSSTDKSHLDLVYADYSSALEALGVN